MRASPRKVRDAKNPWMPAYGALRTMTPEQRMELKALIERELAGAEQTLPSLEQAAQAVAPDNALGRLTRIDSMQDRSMAAAKLNQLLERREQLRDALRRIDSPGFGICNACKQPIALERLLFIPEARVCVPCLNRIQAKARR